MKKFLLFLFIAIGVLVITIAALAIIEPNNITITRSILIKAPKEAVFEQMVQFKNWPHWSPFYELDTTAQYTYTGTDGAEGSSFSWQSSKTDLGSGSLINTSVKGTHFDYHLDTYKPMKNTSTGYMQATDSAGFTKATWSLSMHLSFPMNALQAFPFCNMDKMLGASYERGLDNMKRYVESHYAENPFANDIKEVEIPARTYLGIRKTIPMADIISFCSSSYDTLKNRASAKISGSAIGVYYTWDTTAKTTDMMAAYPVSDSILPQKDLAYTFIDKAKACMIEYKGGYSREMQAHFALRKCAASKGTEQPLVIEEYIAGPKNEPDSNKWVTKIYYLLK